MGVDSKHPLYIEFEPDWIQMRETSKSERVVKDQGTKYLPPTAGMVKDGVFTGKKTKGWKNYLAYRARAVFPEIVSQGIEAMLGVMHHKPAVIEVPAKLEPLIEKATLRNESLQMLLRRINEEQLTTGRLGIMLEVPEKSAALPLIALYVAEDLINWDEGARDETEIDALNLVVIDETEQERTEDGFEWERVEKHRVLVLGDLVENETEGVYRVGVFREGKPFSEDALMEPSISGTMLEEIPFKFINTKDIVPTPDEPPLLGQSNLALTIYRGEADHRQALHESGQDTLVTIGATNSDGSDEIRVGAGASIDLPMGGDAKFIGVDSSGLEEQRLSLESDYTRGESRANGLLEAVSRSAESGEALRVRVSARTASLNQIAMAGAFGLQELLKIAARWIGANPDEVRVEPNLDFVADRLPGNELVGYMTAKGLGAPLSLQSIHEALQERGLTTQTWEDELARLQAEADAGMPGAVVEGEDDTGATEEGDPEEPEEEPEDDEEE